MTRLACVGSLVLVFSGLFLFALPALAQTAKLVTESYHVPAPDTGIQRREPGVRSHAVPIARSASALRCGAYSVLLSPTAMSNTHGDSYPLGPSN
jgi:hypothetical protein